jgi:hypothetical protein
MKLSIRGSDALTLAGIDRIRFNDLVAQGYYPCAPETKKRSARSFELPDVIGLMALGRMLELGVLPRLAGPWACEIVRRLRDKPDLRTAHINRHADNNASMSFDGQPVGQAPILASLVIEVATLSAVAMMAMGEITLSPATE